MNDSTNSIQIRPIHADDYDAWLNLWKQYVDFYQADVSADITAMTWSRLIGEGGNNHNWHRGFVAVMPKGDTSANEIVGFVTYLFHPSTWTANGYCYLEDLFVQSSSRGLGAGRLLIDAVVSATQEADISRVYWHTDTQNETARMLYDSIAKLADMVQYRIVTR